MTQLPPELQTSYLNVDSYPENILFNGSVIYKRKLVSCRKRLDDAEKGLFLLDGEDDVDNLFEVTIMDHETDENKVQAKYLNSLEMRWASAAMQR
jgi:hypothetical protein